MLTEAAHLNIIENGFQIPSGERLVTGRTSCRTRDRKELLNLLRVNIMVLPGIPEKQYSAGFVDSAELYDLK